MDRSSNLPAHIPPIHVDRQLYYRNAKLLSGVVETADTVWGKDQSEYAPAEYGTYGALSTAIYRANKLRADNLARLPLQFWRDTAKGEREEVPDGKVQDLLTRVNPHWTWKRLMRMTEWSLGLWGQSFWYVNRGMNGTGEPKELWWVRPDRMRVVPHPSDYIGGYILEGIGGQQIPFLPSEIIWIPYENPMDEFSGLSPLASARLSVDTSREATRANRHMFSQGMMARGIISPDDKEQVWSPADRGTMEELVSRMGSGAQNKGRWIVLNQMARFTDLDMSAKDVEYLGQLKWTISEVARAYGVPSSMLAENEYSTYSNREQDEKALWSDALLPEAEWLAAELTEKLLPMFPTDRIDELTFDASQIHALQEDQTEIVHQSASWIDRGVPLNAVLQHFAPHLLPEGGNGYEWGDRPLWEAKAANAAQYAPEPGDDDEPPGSMGTTKGEVDSVDELHDADPARKALALIARMRDEQADALAFGSPEHTLRWERFVRQTERRERDWITEARALFRRQQESVLSRLRARSMTRDAEDAENAPYDRDVWRLRWEQLALRMGADVLTDAALETMSDLGVIGTMFDVDNPLVRVWLETAAKNLAKNVDDTTWSAITETLADGIDKGEGIPALAKRIEGVFDDAVGNRATVIARTETVKASAAGSLEAAKQSDVVSHKVWLAAQDERTRESHIAAHGQRRGLEEDFTVGSGSGPAPGQINVAAESIQCRCALTWILKDGRAYMPPVLRIRES